LRGSGCKSSWQRERLERGVIANAIAVLVNAVITFKVIHSGVQRPLTLDPPMKFFSAAGRNGRIPF